MMTVFPDASKIEKGEKEMKSRKLFKVCALLMLAVMSCLLFSGCGGQSEQKKFVITYLPNESTDKNADARKGMAGDLSKVL